MKSSCRSHYDALADICWARIQFPEPLSSQGKAEDRYAMKLGHEVCNQSLLVSASCLSNVGNYHVLNVHIQMILQMLG